jgi:hypothetical protein
MLTNARKTSPQLRRRKVNRHDDINAIRPRVPRPTRTRSPIKCLSTKRIHDAGFYAGGHGPRRAKTLAKA